MLINKNFFIKEAMIDKMGNKYTNYIMGEVMWLALFIFPIVLIIYLISDNKDNIIWLMVIVSIPLIFSFFYCLIKEIIINFNYKKNRTSKFIIHVKSIDRIYERKGFSGGSGKSFIGYKIKGKGKILYFFTDNETISSLRSFNKDSTLTVIVIRHTNVVRKIIK